MSVLTEIRQQKERILQYAHQWGVYDIYIIGPIARGEETKTSNIVLMVRLEPGRNLQDVAYFAQELETVLDRHVDVVLAQSLSWFIREEILRIAVRL